MLSASDVIAGLADRQDRVIACLDTIEQLLPDPTDDRARSIAATRWQLVRALLEYRGFTHRSLFDPAIVGDDPSRATTARRMKERCTATAAAFKEHLARWSPAAGAEHRAAFHAAEAGMVERLRAQLADERAAAPVVLAMPAPRTMPPGERTGRF